MTWLELIDESMLELLLEAEELLDDEALLLLEDPEDDRLELTLELLLLDAEELLDEELEEELEIEAVI